MRKLKKNKFTYVGNRYFIRSDRELAMIDKEEADKAFKRYKKEIIDSMLLNNGFFKWKSNAYVRLNEIGLLEYINLQKERYGSKTFCVNFAVMPLYCGESYMVTDLGNRLGVYIYGKDIWWDYGNENIAKASFENVSEAIIKFVFPWFLEMSSEEIYKKRLKKEKSKIVNEWLAAFEIEDKEPLIEDSIIQLKLPKKILKK